MFNEFGLITISLLAFGRINVNGGIIDPEIFSILQKSTQNGYYVLSPVHYLPISIFNRNIEDSHSIKEEEGGYDIKNNDSNDLKPPHKEYGPPKSEYGPPQRKDDEARSEDPYYRPEFDEAPPNREPEPEVNFQRSAQGPSSASRRANFGRFDESTFFDQVDEGPSKQIVSSGIKEESPHEEYGPPKSEYGPPSSTTSKPAAETDVVIFKSYVEPTFTFGEIPLARYFGDTVESGWNKHDGNKEGY